MVQNKVYIIGVGDDGVDGLSRFALDTIRSADVLAADLQQLSLFSDFQGQVIAFGASLDPLTQFLQRTGSGKLVILASGDPLFYGFTRFLTEKFGKDRFEIIPHVSSMQMAFARVKETWDEAYLTNLATQTLDRAVEKMRSAEKVGIFTTEQDSPSKIASYLRDRGFDYFIGYVCENLGAPDERVTRGNMFELSRLEFSHPNVLILIRRPGVPDRVSELTSLRLFGNPDEYFVQAKPKRGLLTPSEVRAIALSELQLRDDSLVWDVGAGTGSVAIEAARIASRGMVYAIEMDAEDYNLLVENARRFNVSNLVPILGEAPHAWQSLPDPDSVFVGGTGRAVSMLVAQSWQRLRESGTLVANVANLEHVAAVQAVLTEQLNAETEVRLIQIARSCDQFGQTPLESLNPTFLIKASKKQRQSRGE